MSARPRPGQCPRSLNDWYHSLSRAPRKRYVTCDCLIMRIPGRLPALSTGGVMFHTEGQPRWLSMRTSSLLTLTDDLILIFLYNYDMLARCEMFFYFRYVWYVGRGSRVASWRGACLMRTRDKVALVKCLLNKYLIGTKPRRALRPLAHRSPQQGARRGARGAGSRPLATSTPNQSRSFIIEH